MRQTLVIKIDPVWDSLINFDKYYSPSNIIFGINYIGTVQTDHN